MLFTIHWLWKKIRRSISMAFAGIYEVLVTDLQIVKLHIGADIVAITVNQY